MLVQPVTITAFTIRFKVWHDTCSPCCCQL